MIIGNKLVRNIFIFFVVFLIFLNMYYLLEVEGLQEIGDYTYQKDGMTFRGFGWFFNKLGTFPGITPLTDFLADMDSYLSTQDLTEYFSISDLLWLLKVISVPFIMVWKVIVVIFSNIRWVLSWLSPW